MSGSDPFFRLLGIRAAEVPSQPRMPGPLFWMVVATNVFFFAGNVYLSPLARLFNAGKWVPLALLFVVAQALLNKRRAPDLPVIMVVPFTLLLIIASLASWQGVDAKYSMMAILTVVLTVIASYSVSGLVVATDSRRAFFELVGNIGRVLIVVATLMAAARINLGRGMGLTGWVDNPNTLGAMLAPGMIVFMAGCIERRPGWKFWHAFFFVLGFALIWATNARATIAWIGFSGIAFWIYRRGVAISSIGLMAVLVILIGWWQPIRDFAVDKLGLNWSMRDNGISPLSGREEVWRIGWHLFQERPVLGYGIGTSQDLLKIESWRFQRFQGGHFHSSYIMVLVETGIFGFLSFVTLMFATLSRGLADTLRTRGLARENWPLAALPWAMVIGGMGHAIFESWLLAAGNSNSLLFWTCVWMIHHQSQVPVRAVRKPARPPVQGQTPRRPGALPTQ
ncbi:MAG: O-antigen ligase family protein [Pseudomonadota bacterium]